MSRRDPISRLWEGIGTPSSDELRQLARRAGSAPQQVDRPTTVRRRPRARWALAIAAVALLIGSGLGFGIANWVTPSSTASRSVVGFGFLPDAGWTVVQTAGPDPGATTATASRSGIVLSVTSTPRGDPAEDVAYAARELPLQVANARRSSAGSTSFVLRAGVGGYNIDARISFQDSPTRSMLMAAQGQLNRLVVAAARVTIAVRPAVSSPVTAQVTVFGTIDAGKAGESVTVQAKDCGTTFFRAYAGASTEASGTWSTFIFPYVTTRLRAVWNGETSAEVVFRQRTYVGLRQRSPTRFQLIVSARQARFEGKRATIQHFDQRLGRWDAVKTLKVSSDPFGTEFTLRVPKRTRLRAVFPNSQAAPCYLGGTSPIIRT